MEKGGLANGLSQAGIKQADCWLLADEMRLGLHGMVRRVWAPRGVKVRQRRQIVYQWQYLALGVDSVRGKLYWAWLENVKKETLAQLVAEWKEEGIAALVWDGSGSHRARLVKQAGVRLIGLPAYAPELNPAERIIEEIRGKVEGWVYEDLATKRAKAEQFLQELAADPERVRRLAGWEWIQQAARQLPYGTSSELRGK